MSPATYREYQTVLELKSDVLTRKKRGKITKRSFLGCLNCKRKKIKCDETKTQCRNCVKSHLECTWPPRSRESSVVKSEQDTGLLIREPNTYFLPQTPGYSPGFSPSNPRASPLFVSQELSSSREAPIDLPSLTSPALKTENSSPEMRYVDQKSEGTLAESPSMAVVNKTSGLSPESDFFETLGQAFTQASSWIYPSDISDSEAVDASETADLAASNPAKPFGQVVASSLQCVVDLSLSENRSETDMYFLSSFIESFLPTIAQVNFHDKTQFQQLVLAAAKESTLLQEIFIACGASIIAFNHVQYRGVAHERYNKAINHYLSELKHGAVQGGEVWFFVAVQVLQTLCLRDTFADSNATRCAAHFGAAYKIISLRLSNKGKHSLAKKPVSDLEKVMIENFLFNYSIMVFFCDHEQLPQLVPSPFKFFHSLRARLVEVFYDSTDRYKYRSMLAFQIAAKCSWSCRLNLPLDEAGKLLHMEIIQLAEALLLSFQVETDSANNANLMVTSSLARVVLQTSLILLLKMVDFETVRASSVQYLVKGIREEISQEHNRTTIFPIWSLMIAASASIEKTDRDFFKSVLDELLVRSKSRIIVQILNHLDGLWELYGVEEPFELLFDTAVLDQVCN